MSSDDVTIFNNFLKQINFIVRDTDVLSLKFIKTNNHNNTLYEFNEQNDLNCKLLSYNDKFIKTTYDSMPLVMNLLENPLYTLMFTNTYFSFFKLNQDVFENFEFYSDNIKKLLLNNKIMNLQTKELFDLTQKDINTISQFFSNVNYTTIVENLYQNNMYTYSLVSSFFGIKINYWRLSENSVKAELVNLPVNIFLLNKMNINNPPVYNILDIFYRKADNKLSFYSFYLTFQITPELRKFYLGCK